MTVSQVSPPTERLGIDVDRTFRVQRTRNKTEQKYLQEVGGKERRMEINPRKME